MSFDNTLAGRLGQQPNDHIKPMGTAPLPPEPLCVPVTVMEQPRKREQQMNVRRSTDKAGKPVIVMVPNPGWAVSRIVMADIDDTTRRAKVGVVCERRRGHVARWQKSKAKGNGPKPAA